MDEFSMVSFACFGQVFGAGFVDLTGHVNLVFGFINRGVSSAVNGVGGFILFKNTFQRFLVKYVGFSFGREIDIRDTFFYGYFFKQLPNCPEAPNTTILFIWGD